MSADELYQVFLSVLDVHGFIAAPSGTRSVKIVPKINARVSGNVTEASSTAAAGDANCDSNHGGKACACSANGARIAPFIASRSAP